MPQEITSFFRKLLDLREGAEEKHVIIENVKDDSDINSAQFWTLVFAIGVASVGLNINSIPVVIGAMLISPLMGPIVSVGLALAINDWGLMRRSMRNLMVLVTISIVISAIYFALTPITNAQSELLSRTQPTIFDVLIAIFGGVVGFIGVSRARYNNVIPGAAIATALIPPLCTVGYGIATLQLSYVFGAFYLFLINCIFICLSALLVAKYLKLPKVVYTNQAFQHKVRRIITTLIIVIVTPAVFFAATFVKQNNFIQNADSYIKSTFEDRGYLIIYKNINYKSNPKVIELAFLSDRFSKEQITEFEARLVDFKLKDTKLSIRQNGFSLTDQEWQSVMSGVQNNEAAAKALEARLGQDNSLISDVITEDNNFSSYNSEKILLEAKVINSSIKNIAIGYLTYGETEAGNSNKSLVVFVHTDISLPPLEQSEVETITKWLEARLGQSSIEVYFVPPISTSTSTEEGS